MEKRLERKNSPLGAVQTFLRGDVSTLFALFGMIALFGILSPYFLTVKNIMSIGSYASIQGIMAAGLTCCMLLGGMDVSQFSLAGLCGMFMGLMYEAGMNEWLIIPLTLIIGILAGCINATIVEKLKISVMIATMGMQFVIRGFCYIITGGAYVYIKSDMFNFIGSGKLFGVFPFCLLVMIIVYIVIWYALKYTKFGRNLYACGGNLRAASLAGINTTAMRYKAHMISSFCAAIGGIIMTSQQTAAMCNAGEGNDMDCIAAVILGGLGLAGGKGKVTGTLIGVLIICVLFNGMTMLNVQVYWQKVLKGVVLLLAVFIDSLRSGLLKKA